MAPTVTWWFYIGRRAMGLSFRLLLQAIMMMLMIVAKQARVCQLVVQ